MKKNLKEKIQSTKDQPITTFGIRRHFARLFVHRLLPLVKNQHPGQSHTPCSVTIEEAYHKFHRESEGRLIFSESRYLGDHIRHNLFCHDCRNHFMASFEEVITSRPKTVCPHCLGDNFLKRFKNIKQIQTYCVDVSFHTSYFLGNNKLGGTMTQRRNFYCLLHKILYQASMKQFLTDSHGCPVCTKENHARGWD